MGSPKAVRWPSAQLRAAKKRVNKRLDGRANIDTPAPETTLPAPARRRRGQKKGLLKRREKQVFSARCERAAWRCRAHG